MLYLSLKIFHEVPEEAHEVVGQARAFLAQLHSQGFDNGYDVLNDFVFHLLQKHARDSLERA
jgi:hypothetical protein